MARVLLVEDDDLQRMAYRRFLELEGHQVTETSEGEEAVNLFRRNPSAIDVVVTDVLIPGLDGVGLIHALLKIKPHLPIVAISAGRRVLTPEFTLNTAVFAGAAIQLAKPFTRQDLKQAIDKALSA